MIFLDSFRLSILFGFQKIQFFYSRNYAEACKEVAIPIFAACGACATQKRRSGGEPLVTVPDLNDPRIEPQTYRA